MPQPDFSILSSAYRTEAYLAATIDSVRAQTIESWELIIVDNGMSEEVVRIVGRYAQDPRIRLVRQDNKGLGGGIDAAADVARGRFYAVLDSDDLLMPEFCARTAAILDARPEIDVVGIDAHLFNDSNGQNQLRGYRQSVGITSHADLEHRISLPEMIRGEVLYYTAAIRADAWKTGEGYSCDTPKVEDLAMFMRMLAHGCDIRVLPQRLARYRLRGDSFSRDPEHVEAFEESLEQAFMQATKLSDAAEVQQALQVTLHQLRYYQALRRSRAALLASDVGTARAQARRALHHRRTARAAVVYAGLVVAPGALRRIHPAKQRASAAGASIARAAAPHRAGRSAAAATVSHG